MSQAMNSFGMATGETSMSLTQAVLIYTQDGPKSRASSENPALYATVHSVQNFGTEANPNFQIAAGTPVTQEALRSMFGELQRRMTLNTELIPENVLSISGDHMVWWLPACERSVFFKTKELGERSAKTPHPPLMFAVVKGQWFVYALAKNERPRPETELHFAPYFNVFDSGAICTGSAQVPRGISASATAKWEEAFFDSQFTHISGEKKKATHPRGEYALWKELLDGEHKTFPVQYLAPFGKTLQEFMGAVRTKLGAN